MNRTDSNTAGPLFSSYRATVTPAVADYNGHMNVGHFPLQFEEGTCALFEHLDISRAYRGRTNHAIFAVEQHLVYRAELRIGEAFSIQSQMLAVRPKLFHVMSFMVRSADGAVAATNEMLFLHVDLSTRRSVPMPVEVEQRLQRMREAHSSAPWPDEAGRNIRIRT
jgi:acyl-CoA thioester hydrolase